MTRLRFRKGECAVKPTRSVSERPSADQGECYFVVSAERLAATVRSDPFQIQEAGANARIRTEDLLYTQQNQRVRGRSSALLSNCCQTVVEWLRHGAADPGRQTSDGASSPTMLWGRSEPLLQTTLREPTG